MTRIRIDSDERYPDYSIRSDTYGHEVEATDDQIARWAAAAEAYAAAQDEMGDLYEAAEAAERQRKADEKVQREAREKAEREEQRRNREAESRQRNAATERMLGTVYDADGNPVGEVSRSHQGLTVRPIVPSDS